MEGLKISYEDHTRFFNGRCFCVMYRDPNVGITLKYYTEFYMEISGLAYPIDCYLTELKRQDCKILSVTKCVVKDYEKL